MVIYYENALTFETSYTNRNLIQIIHFNSLFVIYGYGLKNALVLRHNGHLPYLLVVPNNQFHCSYTSNKCLFPDKNRNIRLSTENGNSHAQNRDASTKAFRRIRGI